ncbi:MAG: quinone-dependent dihydroorotate dehydrogenase [Paracoccaceae bacterium]
MKQLLMALGLPLLRQMDPEAAHRLAITALRYGLAPAPDAYTTPRLATTLAGLALPNPVGLAAGFDKNAQAIAPLLRSGFGFIELGAATPRAQPGNARPRLFRLREDRAVINRFGFNNEGADAIAARLQARPKSGPKSGTASGIVGLNLGANKDSADRAADFAEVLRICGPFVDFATVNVSSPNTEKLRDLQGKAALSALLAGVMEARAALPRPVPVFLKIAPDLDLAALDDIAGIAASTGLDAIIATNTTLARNDLASPHRAEAGGLSGAPLFEPSTRILAQLSLRLEGKTPLVGVGGIATGAQAYEKIRAGASAVQLYSALVYGGIGLVNTIARDLDALLVRDGYASVADAVGSGRSDWLAAASSISG